MQLHLSYLPIGLIKFNDISTLDNFLLPTLNNQLFRYLEVGIIKLKCMYNNIL